VTLPLADHGLLLAIPFVVPVLLVFAGIGLLMLRDRRRGNT